MLKENYYIYKDHIHNGFKYDLYDYHISCDTTKQVWKDLKRSMLLVAS